MRTGPQQNSTKMGAILRQLWLANERPDILKYNHFRRYILLQANERPDILKYNHFRRYILLQGLEG